ncbi:MAG: AAA family ATPase [Prevotella sp.]
MADNNVGPLASIVGMEDIKKQLQALVSRFDEHKRRMATSGVSQPFSANIIISGEMGTGKSMLVDAIQQLFQQKGITKHAPTYILNSEEFDVFRTPKDFDANLAKAKGGILCIDAVHKLLPNGQDTQTTPLDRIFSGVQTWKGDPVVILCGWSVVLDGYLKNNPNLRDRFDLVFHLQGYTYEQLVEICIRRLQLQHGLGLTEEAREKLKRVIRCAKRKNLTDTNGYYAKNLADNIAITHGQRQNSLPIIQPDEIEGEEYVEKSFNQAIQQLDKYIGVEKIKEKIQNLTLMMRQEADRKGTEIRCRDHFLFLGNPGTGKTTIARVFADILSSMGVLKVGQLVEVSRKELVAPYVGQTAPMVEAAVNKAIGGILFIDEAYTLVQNENDSFGQEAIDCLLKLMEDRRGEFVCIAAGYDKEMGEFLKTNSGLASRFNETIHFDDYTGEQLYDIFQMMLKGEKITLDSHDETWARNYFQKMYLMRNSKFGNARDVRNVLDKAKKQQAKRIFELQKTQPAVAAAEDTVLRKMDIVGNENEKTKDEVLAELDAFVGMDSIKKQVRELANKILIERMSIDAGVGTAELTPVHILLTGNPGTGKTTIARKMGELFKAIGMLPSDKVLEHDRSTLISKYSNESSELMSKACDDAMGGILFIDEAYTLAPPSPGGGGSQDKVGVEAVETLMKRMEDDRGKFVVICAGYRKEMDEFLLTNPGLSRRFTHKMHIEDYTAEQLQQIFVSMTAKKNYTIVPEAMDTLTRCIRMKVDAKDQNFGNAGEMVKLFEETKRRLSSRLAEKMSISGQLQKEDFTTILPEDIPYDGPKKVSVTECLSKLDNLVGLDSVKDDVRKMALMIQFEQKRAQLNGDMAKIVPDHYVFSGNPGTGKTTVARIMADIFFSLGLLPTNKLIETARQNLVVGLVGQTAPNVEAVVRSALGGVLFIDEAYTLNQGRNDDFGHEAIDTLVKLMLDYKGRLVVIIAGYTQDIQDFLDSNAGLASRFTKKIAFEDYRPEELQKIFIMAATKDKYVLTPEAEDALRQRLTDMYVHRDRNFGNARSCLNLYNSVRQAMATRMMTSSEITPETMSTILPVDIINAR